jgi:hypothetical protein
MDKISLELTINERRCHMSADKAKYAFLTVRNGTVVVGMCAPRR